MLKIMFVCHGNICRSPMAEFVFKDMVNKEGLSDKFYVDSAATSTEEIMKIAEQKGYRTTSTSESVLKYVIDKLDLILVMTAFGTTVIQLCSL